VSGLEVRCISTVEELESLSPQWDALVRAMPRPSPFLLHGWLVAWWRHFGSDAELALHVAERDGRLVAALPLFVRRRRGVRVAAFLGGHESALADLLLAPGADAATADVVIRAALAGSSGADLVDLYGLPGESRLVAALAAAGRPLRLLRRSDAPVLDLTRGWSEVYAAKVTGKRRNLQRRRRRQLGELGRLETAVARTPAELERALEEAFRLHEVRWRDRPDLSTFGSEQGRRFHRAALAAVAPLDVARITSLTLDGQPIAFHYYFLLERRMVVHHLAYDPAHGRLSPGLVNTYDAIEAAADEGAAFVEFLGGAERYKLELADGLAPLFQGLGLARGVRGHAALLLRVAALEARRRLKQSKTLRRLYYEPGARRLRRGST
jgi:CelD/BcsL family acetyltransferase involved in cellulose biosynthesis